MEPATTSPFGISWQKLMMWFFLVGDAILFASVLAGYGFVRLAAPNWPDRGAVFHLTAIGCMTLVLVSSGATMAACVDAARRGRWRSARWLLAATIVAGIVFLGMQAHEWRTMINAGASLRSNPWGVPQFAASFFVITGFHGAHVLSGLILLGTVMVRSWLGRLGADGLELAGLYWAFIDLVWVFIFGLFYLV